MYRLDTWYNYKNKADTSIRYILEHDTTETGAEVYVLICMYNENLLNTFTYCNEENAQHAMRMLVEGV